MAQVALLLAAAYGVACGVVDPVNNAFFSFLFFSIFIFALPSLQPWRFGAASFFAAVPQFPLRRRVVPGASLIGCTTPLPPNPEVHRVLAALGRPPDHLTAKRQWEPCRYVTETDQGANQRPPGVHGSWNRQEWQFPGGNGNPPTASITRDFLALLLFMPRQIMHH